MLMLGIQRILEVNNQKNVDLNDRLDLGSKRDFERQWFPAPKKVKNPKYPAPPRVVKEDPKVTWTVGLMVATHYELSKEYESRNGYRMSVYDTTFWGWIKHFPQIDLDDCKSQLGWAIFKNECIEGSGIRPSMLELNIEHIVNSGSGRYEVLDALNIPVNRNYQENTNRPGYKFGGELYAFVSSKSGFFNAKPKTPQWDTNEGKYRKYESARKLEGEEGNKIFYPDVDQIACDLLMDRYPELRNTRGGARINPGNYWKVILSRYPDLSFGFANILAPLPLIEVGTTEGAKKATSLTGQGYPTVATFGICNWSVSGSTPRVLLPELAELAKGGRSMPIWYDMDDPDEKIKAFLNGKSQGHKLRAALIAAGADPKTTRPMFWDLKLGKGIDDALVTLKSQGKDIGDWIDHAIQYSREAEIYAQTSKAYKLDPKRAIYRSTIGDYLPGDIILKPGHTTALIVDTGGGKTHQMRIKVADVGSNGEIAIVMAPTNALGQQVAEDLGLPHRHSCQSDSQLLAQARRAGGMVLCPDSLYLVTRLLELGQPYVVVLDEAAKVLEHVTTGSTLKDRYSKINQDFAALLKNAESLIIAEAQLSEQDLLTVEAMSGKPTLVYQHKKLTAKREIKKYYGAAQIVTAALTNDILTDLGTGKKTLICCDSQRQAEKLERIIRAMYPERDGIRVDSHTAWESDVQDIITNPNQYLAEKQLNWMIYTSITKAGWNLTGFHLDAYGVKHEYHFDRIYGFLNVLPTSDHIQMLGRYRPGIPITIACPPLIPTTGDEAVLSRKALEKWREDSLENAIKMTKVERGVAIPLQAIVDNLYVHNTVRNGLEKSIANYAIWQRLVDDGHTVIDRRISMADLAINDPDLYKKIQLLEQNLTEIGVEIEKDWGDFIGSIPLSPSDDVKEAIRLEKLESPTPRQRAKAAKIRLSGRFAGVDFDDAQTAYYSTRKYGKLANGVERHAKLSFVEVVAARQLIDNTEILKKPVVAAHHLSHQEQQIGLLLHLGIVDLLSGEYCGRSPEMIALHQKCVELAPNCKRFLGLTFKPEDGTITVFSRLVSKLSLSLVESRREGSGGRVRYYQVVNHHLLTALMAKSSDRKTDLEGKIATSKAELAAFTLPTTDSEKDIYDRVTSKYTEEIQKWERSYRWVDAKIADLTDKWDELQVRDLLYPAAIDRLKASSQANSSPPIALVGSENTTSNSQVDYKQAELNIPPDLPDLRTI
jgi:Domain of unknown function (DUF3854)